MAYDDYADEEWVDNDDDDDDGDDLLTCPFCREPVHEDTQQCPHCGDWITPVAAESHWKRIVWIVAVALLILAMTLLTMF